MADSMQKMIIHVSMLFILGFYSLNLYSQTPFGRVINKEGSFSSHLLVNGGTAEYENINPYDPVGNGFFPFKLFNHKPLPIFITYLYFDAHPNISSLFIKYNTFKSILMYKKYIGSCVIELAYAKWHFKITNITSSNAQRLSCQWDQKANRILINIK